MRSLYLERFRKNLASRNQKLTAAREGVVDAVLAMRCDFSADELQERMQLMHAERVSRSTLFRTLERLVDAKMLDRFVADQAATYRVNF